MPLPDGGLRVVETALTARQCSDGRRVLQGVARDTSAQARAEEQLRLAASVFRNAREGIFITAPDSRILDVNDAFCRITGYRRHEILGNTPALLRSGQHDQSFYRALWTDLRTRGHWEGEIWNRRKNGDLFPEHLSIHSVFDDRQRLSHFVAIFEDVSEARERESRLAQLANFDAVTGLPHLPLLADRIRQAKARARRFGHRLAVACLDIDGFKGINDRFGHDGGDELLRQVAGRLRQMLRSADTASRLGGDEFVLLLPEIGDGDDCSRLLARLLEGLDKPYLLRGHFTDISASIGATLFPDDDSDTDTLIRHASQAMHRAKEAGRNRFELFDVAMAQRSRDHQACLVALSRALETGELLLHYQPKVNLRSGEVYGAEALVRWQHPEEGLLLPARFIRFLEDPLLFKAFGDWLLRGVMQQQRRWQAQGLDIVTSVNISPQHLQLPEFVADLGQLLQQYDDIPPDRLELEILETSAVRDLEAVAATLAECSHLGVGVAIDDFGTGYSSLTYLRTLRSDTLKIDQSFVRGMLTDVGDRAIVEGIIRLAQVFRRAVIAEGVESEEHGLELMRLGCHLAQGYAVARPMAPAELPGWIAAYRPPRAWRFARPG